MDRISPNASTWLRSLSDIWTMLPSPQQPAQILFATSHPASICSHTCLLKPLPNTVKFILLSTRGHGRVLAQRSFHHLACNPRPCYLPGECSDKPPRRYRPCSCFQLNAQNPFVRAHQRPEIDHSAPRGSLLILRRSERVRLSFASMPACKCIFGCTDASLQLPAKRTSSAVRGTTVRNACPWVYNFSKPQTYLGNGVLADMPMFCSYFDSRAELRATSPSNNPLNLPRPPGSSSPLTSFKKQVVVLFPRN